MRVLQKSDLRWEGGGGSRKTNIWREFPKKGEGGLKRGRSWRKKGVVFWGVGVVDTPMHTMNLTITLTVFY